MLGAGNFASAVMLPALKAIPTFELVGIASASGMSAKHAADRFGFHYATSDEAQVLNDPQVDVVAILTRHNLHARQVIAALHAHKHVFCEKPLALNQTELEAIQEALIEPWNSPDTARNRQPAAADRWLQPPLRSHGAADAGLPGRAKRAAGSLLPGQRRVYPCLRIGRTTRNRAAGASSARAVISSIF